MESMQKNRVLRSEVFSIMSAVWIQKSGCAFNWVRRELAIENYFEHRSLIALWIQKRKQTEALTFSGFPAYMHLMTDSSRATFSLVHGREWSMIRSIALRFG